MKLRQVPKSLLAAELEEVERPLLELLILQADERNTPDSYLQHMLDQDQSLRLLHHDK